MWRWAAALALLAGGCVHPPADGALHQVAFADLPGWQADHVADALPALQAECRRLERLPADTALGGTGLAQQTGGRAGQWWPACTASRTLDAGDTAGVRSFFEHWFQPYRIGAPALVTGYFEPEVPGALAPGGAYTTALLSRPTDLRQGTGTGGAPSMGRLHNGRVTAYWTRAEIEAGRAGAAAHALLWLADPADLFFLQIQGSGRVRLPDGEVVRVGYDGKNGRPYTPIGRVLAEQGALAPQDVTMQSVRAWLAAHPDQARAVMDRNEDYVFFRIITDAEPRMGPPGALGTHLLPGRTVAVDRAATPLATPLFLDMSDPRTGAPWQRLLLAQDLGTDIVGPARIDVFLGAGAEAGQLAGRMRQPGTAYLLLPRPPA